MHAKSKEIISEFLHDLSGESWSKKRGIISQPAQSGGGGCGAFVCFFVETFLKTFSFEQTEFWGIEHIPFYRLRMISLLSQ
jgi:Ulp1 family protease